MQKIWTLRVTAVKIMRLTMRWPWMRGDTSEESESFSLYLIEKCLPFLLHVFVFLSFLLMEMEMLYQTWKMLCLNAFNTNIAEPHCRTPLPRNEIQKSSRYNIIFANFIISFLRPTRSHRRGHPLQAFRSRAAAFTYFWLTSFSDVCFFCDGICCAV